MGLVFCVLSHLLRDETAWATIKGTIQKVTVMLRILAYGSSADQLDEWIWLGESTINKCLKHFVRAIIKSFGVEYLRAPTVDDTGRILAQNAARGWPGCLGSIDCWFGSGRIVQQHGQVSILEWKAEGVQQKCVAVGICGFGICFVVIQVPWMTWTYWIVAPTPQVTFTVNNKQHNHPYWPADGIYPKMPVFVQGFTMLNNDIDKNFTLWQASDRKDIGLLECCMLVGGSLHYQQSIGIIFSWWHCPMLCHPPQHDCWGHNSAQMTTVVKLNLMILKAA